MSPRPISSMIRTWFHGEGGGELDTNVMMQLHAKLARRILFFVPLCPGQDSEGFRYHWGVRYSKRQNAGGRGFIYGDIHYPLNNAIGETLYNLIKITDATASIVAGYSMGAYEAWLLAALHPQVITILIAAAGYGYGYV